MLTDKDEIAAIIDAAMSPYLPDVESVRILIVPAILAASEAIAALLTLAHRMSEFVTVNSFRGYDVPDPKGRHNVWIDEDQIICWDSKNRRCYDSDGGGRLCPHILAVELWLARQEAKK